MSRLLSRPVVLVSALAAVLACDSQPLDVGAAPGSPAKDADAFAATYAPDARFLDPIGNMVEGREAIRAQHAFLFGGPFAPSTETQVIADIRFPTGTVAIVCISTPRSPALPVCPRA